MRYVCSSPLGEQPATMTGDNYRELAAKYAVSVRGWKDGLHEIWVQEGTQFPCVAHCLTLEIGPGAEASR